MRLNEWGLGGRGFGIFVSWFLLGGDIYTAQGYSRKRSNFGS